MKIQLPKRVKNQPELCNSSSTPPLLKHPRHNHGLSSIKDHRMPQGSLLSKTLIVRAMTDSASTAAALNHFKVLSNPSNNLQDFSKPLTSSLRVSTEISRTTRQPSLVKTKSLTRHHQEPLLQGSIQNRSTKPLVSRVTSAVVSMLLGLKINT